MGDLCWDVYLGGMESIPQMGAEVFAGQGSMKPGGSAANTAMILAMCGAPVTFYGAVGNDSAGRRIAGELEESGLDNRFISRLEGQQTGFTVVLTYQDQGERMLVTSPGSLDKARLVDFLPGYLKRNAHLHLASYFIQSALSPEIGGLLELARLEGMTASLDPGHDPFGNWDLSALSSFRECLDWFMPNRTEFLSITGSDSLVGAMERFMPGTTGLVVKDGPGGAYLKDKEESEILHFPSSAMEVLDTTCAGDAFNAGFLYALCRGDAPSDAVLLGNSFGAASCRVMGLPRDKDYFRKLID